MASAVLMLDSSTTLTTTSCTASSWTPLQYTVLASSISLLSSNKMVVTGLIRSSTSANPRVRSSYKAVLIVNKYAFESLFAPCFCNNGVCDKTYTCTCSAGYGGSLCSKQCDTCSNGGECSRETGYCSCPAG